MHGASSQSTAARARVAVCVAAVVSSCALVGVASAWSRSGTAAAVELVGLADLTVSSQVLAVLRKKGTDHA
jgi:hypothetical protein